MENRNEVITINLIEYEIIGRWWTSFIFFGWGRSLAIKYIVWKTNRKYRRWKEFKEWQSKLTPSLNK